MESVEVRREYLRQGGRLRATAAALGVKHPSVAWHVARANRIAPLTYQAGDPEDRKAMRAYVLAQLARVGIATDG